MDTTFFISIVKESVFVLTVFSFFLIYAIVRGRQHLINVVMGLYFALLISLEFPYYDVITGKTDSAGLTIGVFVIFTILSTFLFKRLMPSEYLENAFESLGKKLLLALAATALIMAYSYHVLPITALIDPGTPMQTLFASESSFFWWLFAPLVVLFLI